MAEIKSKLILDDSGFINPLKDVISTMEKTQKGLEELQSEANDAGKEIGKSFEDGAKKATKSSAEIAESQQKVKQSLTETIRSFSLYGISLGDVADRLSSAKNGALNYFQTLRSGLSVSKDQAESIQRLSRGSVLLQGGLRGLTVGFNLLKVAIAATGIGLLIVSIASLIAFFNKTERGALELRRIIAGLQIVATKLGDEAAKLGEKIFDAFTNPKKAIVNLWGVIKENFVNRFDGLISLFGALGDGIKAAFTLDGTALKKAASEAGTALLQVGSGFDEEQRKKVKEYFAEVGKGIKQAVDDTDKLEIGRANLLKLQDEFLIREALNLSKIAELKKISEDTTKSLSERITAGDKLQKIQAEELRNKEIIAEKTLELVKLDKNRAENLQADNTELAIAEAALFRVRAEQTEKSIESQNAQNSRIKEATDLLKTYSKEVLDLSAQLGLVSESEAFDILKSEQILKLTEYSAKLSDIGKALGIDVNDELDLLNKVLVTLDRKSFFDTAPEKIGKVNQQVKNLSDRIEFLLLKPIQLRTQVDNDQINGLITQLSLLDPEAANGLRQRINKPFEINAKITIPEVDSLLSDIEKLFNKIANSPELQGAIQGLNEFGGAFGNILQEATQLQLNEIDKLLEQSTKRREQLETDLDRELELNELGLANNLELKQAEVDELLAEEARLQEEREKIQKKAQQQQLLLDTAQQAQSLITASINIIKGFSNIPIVGLPLGIAAVATLTAFFAKTKAQAFAATRLYKGADRIGDYFGEVGHRTDIPGRGEGYRVIDAVTGQDTNVRISGREMILPESITKSQKALFDGLKKGMYNFDIAERLNMIEAFKGLPVAQPIVMQKPDQPRRMKQYVPFVSKNGRSGAKLMEIREGSGGIVWFDV